MFGIEINQAGIYAGFACLALGVVEYMALARWVLPAIERAEEKRRMAGEAPAVASRILRPAMLFANIVMFPLLGLLIGSLVFSD